MLSSGSFHYAFLPVDEIVDQIGLSFYLQNFTKNRIYRIKNITKTHIHICSNYFSIKILSNESI